MGTNDWVTRYLDLPKKKRRSEITGRDLQKPFGELKTVNSLQDDNVIWTCATHSWRVYMSKWHKMLWQKWRTKVCKPVFVTQGRYLVTRDVRGWSKHYGRERCVCRWQDQGLNLCSSLLSWQLVPLTHVHVYMSKWHKFLWKKWRMKVCKPVFETQGQGSCNTWRQRSDVSTMEGSRHV